MHILTINVNDNSFDRVMNFLKNEKVDIVEEKEINKLNIEQISKDDPDYQYILEAKKENNKSYSLEEVKKKLGF